MTRRSHWRVLVGLSVAGVAASGCSVLRPQPDRTKFYVLTAASRPAEAPTPDFRDVVVGLGPLTLPPYLERDRVIRRLDENRVELLEYERWAEPLQASVRRILAQDLARMLGIEEVLTYPWQVTQRVDLTVAMDILRFEPAANGATELRADWTIRDGATHALLLSRDTVLSVPAADPSMSAAVGAMSRALGELAQAVAAGLREARQAQAAAAPVRKKQ
jgi:uncharacterized lipoprotein YmbA